MTSLEKLKFRLRYQLYAKLKANFYPSYNFSHSQFGEDMVVRFLTENVKRGFYVDIGAHHPVFYSNTYHFYCKGWNGINIDAAPKSMEAFQILRPRDINLEACLSSKEGQEVDFYMFDRAACNTFDSTLAEQELASGAILLERRKLITQSLAVCLEKHLPEHQQIDFMSVDVEGMDEEILMSNDWDRYKPTIIIFEMHEVPFRGINELPLTQYLTQYGYELVAKCGPSVIMACPK